MGGPILIRGINDPIPNAAQPTPGQGIVLDLDGKVPDDIIPIRGVLAYATRTGNVATAGTTYAAGADLLAADLSFAADGASDYLVACTAVGWLNSAGNASHTANLKLDNAEGGGIQQTFLTVAGVSYVFGGSTVIIGPASGAHTINIRVYTNAGTCTVLAGSGGVGANCPLLVTVSRL